MTALLNRYNFLRSYADTATIEKMSVQERSALLNQVIATGESENSWRAILELFASWPESNEKLNALELADQQLSLWSYRTRSVNSSWIYLYNESDGLSSVAKLARSISINRREQYGNKELKSIVTSPFVIEVRELIISKSEIYAGGIKALSDSNYLKNLEHLSIDGVTLQAHEFETLFSTQNFPSLTSLELKDMRINSERLKYLLRSNLIRTVKHLNLSYDNLGDADVQSLTESGIIKQLQSLHLEGNYIRGDGAVKLLNESLGSNLSELNLSRNEISETVKRDIQAMLDKSHIKLNLG